MRLRARWASKPAHPDRSVLPPCRCRLRQPRVGPLHCLCIPLFFRRFRPAAAYPAPAAQGQAPSLARKLL